MMRILPMVAVLGAAMTVLGTGAAQAQMRCDPSRCIDVRTGAYTQSGCNYQGCYPISGVVGYADPAATLGYGSGYPQHRYHRDWRWGY